MMKSVFLILLVCTAVAAQDGPWYQRALNRLRSFGQRVAGFGQRIGQGFLGWFRGTDGERDLVKEIRGATMDAARGLRGAGRSLLKVARRFTQDVISGNLTAIQKRIQKVGDSLMDRADLVIARGENVSEALEKAASEIGDAVMDAFDGARDSLAAAGEAIIEAQSAIAEVSRATVIVPGDLSAVIRGLMVAGGVVVLAGDTVIEAAFAIGNATADVIDGAQSVAEVILDSSQDVLAAAQG